MSQRSSTAAQRSDVVLVGGGLANSLIALELRRRRPELAVTVLDEVAEPAAHTWCLFASDAEPDVWSRLSGRLDNRWDGYSVDFPGRAREIDTPYGRLSSTTLRREVRAALGDGLLVGSAVEVGPDHVTCADGRRLEAPLVVDGRGAAPSPHLDVAFQKFVGLDLQLKRPHGLSGPVVMDATVRQIDGFRFIYVLPLSEDRLLVEDTRYSDGPTLSASELQAEILRYARGASWAVRDVVGSESGALPVLLGGDIDAYWSQRRADVPAVGMAGVFFHPVTGYSFPDALRVADLVAQLPDLTSAAVAARLREHSTTLWRQRGFYRLLSRLLFKAAAPDQRRGVLEHFYRLPQPVIERFYAGRSTLSDKLRVLSGRPPVPVLSALKAMAPARVQHA